MEEVDSQRLAETGAPENAPAIWSKGRKRCLNSQGNFRMIENSTAGVEIWPYLMGCNFGQQNVVKTYNTCVVIFQILEYVIRVLIRVVRCTLYTPMGF